MYLWNSRLLFQNKTDVKKSPGTLTTLSKGLFRRFGQFVVVNKKIFNKIHLQENFKQTHKNHDRRISYGFKKRTKSW